MAQNITFNGAVYTIPDVGDNSWGLNLRNYFVAIPQGSLQKTGGTFTLSSEVNFGATYGLLAAYVKSRSTNPASTGLIRLNLADTIAWRNNANDGNLALAVNGSDQLTFNGTLLTTGGITALTGDVTASGPGSAASTIANHAVSNAKLRQSAGLSVIGNSTNSLSDVADIVAGSDYTLLTRSGTSLIFNLLTNNNIDAAAAIAYSKLNLTNSIVSADISGSISIAKGGTGVTSATTTPTASSFAGWDTNSNLKANSFIEGYATTATAAGTTVLTVASAVQQFFTGVTTQTITLPVASTMALGQKFIIVNLSTGVLTVNSSGGNFVQTVQSQVSTTITCILTSGTSAASWSTASSSGVGNLVANYFSGNGSTTGFTLSVDPGSENNTFVHIDGVYQQKDTYTVSGTTLTFSAAPPPGSSNIEVMIGTTLAIGTPSDGTVTRAKIDVASAFIAPTIQKFTSGSGTYTLPISPATPKYIRVRMVGGGGGGAGSGSSAGTAATAGGASTFGTTLLVANGGAKGDYGVYLGGTGGTASLGSGPIGTALSGATGGGASYANGISGVGGMGGSTPFGGAGPNSCGQGGVGTFPGGAAIANSGSGGGGSGSNGASGNSGAGGGAAGFVDAIITSPSATYAYAVGTAGTAGGAGATVGSVGGAGGSGYIEVTEYYQ